MSRWTGVVTMIAGVALLAGCGAGDDTGATGATADEGASTASASAKSLELTVPAAPAGRCMAPNVANLSAQDTAFEGTVAELADGKATLQVDQMYTGDEVETVTVAAPSADLSGLVLAVDFQAGQTYLVSSLDGQVSVCGLSGPKDERLSGLYDEAYTG